LHRIGTLFARRTDAAGGVEDTQRQLEAVRAGERIVSFPEGTLTRMPGLLGFRLGAFLVAAQAGVPVVPITIRGTRSILRGDQWFARRGDVELRIGEAMLPKAADWGSTLDLRTRAYSWILARCGETASAAGPPAG
jgi:1-acyl-sn-glycerol-3-phosphate acyltransferase